MHLIYIFFNSFSTLARVQRSKFSDKTTKQKTILMWHVWLVSLIVNVNAIRFNDLNMLKRYKFYKVTLRGIELKQKYNEISITTPWQMLHATRFSIWLSS